MSSFRNTPEEWQRLDYQILQNGWASLYWKPENLLLDIEWFKSKNFRIAEIDCAEANNLLFEIGKKLDFHNYSGKSLDAFNDCLSDIEINESSTIVVLRHFHLIDTKIAHSLLSVFADNSRRHILFGKKLLTLIQVDDPKYTLEPIGSTPVLWNRREWMNSERGL